MAYYIDRIWQFKDKELSPRPSSVTLDEATCYAGSADQGPLHISSGLTRRNVVVFMGVLSLEEVETTGYMVTDVQRDGSGILVAGDIMAEQPRTWVNTRTIGLWRALAREGFSLEDFGLPELQSYIESLPNVA